MAPPRTSGGPPAGLLDLPDEAVSLIAEHVWAAKGDGRGLVGACRRTRRIGLAALPSLVLPTGKISWISSRLKTLQFDSHR